MTDDTIIPPRPDEKELNRAFETDAEGAKEEIPAKKKAAKKKAAKKEAAKKEERPIHEPADGELAEEEPSIKKRVGDALGLIEAVANDEQTSKLIAALKVRLRRTGVLDQNTTQ
jgi:hypothetical protein